MTASRRAVRDPLARKVLEAALPHFRDDPSIRSVAAFGSAARGESRAGSDLDLLVVRTESASPSQIRQAISDLLQDSDVHASVIVRTADRLAEECRARPSFAAHLIDEAVVIYENGEWEGLARLLRQVSIDKVSLEREVRERASDLDVFAPIERFNGRYVAYGANLYAIGRSVVIARLLESGVHEYNWRRIFSLYSTVRPDLANELRRIATLRPFYEVSRERDADLESLTPMPEDDARRAFDAVARVSRS